MGWHDTTERDLFVTHRATKALNKYKNPQKNRLVISVNLLKTHIAATSKSLYTPPNSPEVGVFAVTLKSIKTQAYQIVFWQLMIIMGLAAVLFLLSGIQNGIGTLLGGLAYWLPTFFFAWRVFRRAALKTGRAFIVSFLAGEVGKLLLSGLLFVLVVKYMPVTPAATIIGFAGAIMAFWIACVVFLIRHPGATL